MSATIGTFGAFADLVHRRRRVVIRHGDTNDLAAGLDHLIDLPDSAVDIGRVGLGHRLNDDRRTAADRNVPNHYLSCFPIHSKSQTAG